MMSSAEHLLMYRLFFRKISMLILFPLLIGCLFLCHRVARVPYMYWMLTICQIDGLQIFFPSPYFHPSSCILLMVSCVVHKRLSWMQSHWFIFVFVAYALGVK